MLLQFVIYMYVGTISFYDTIKLAIENFNNSNWRYKMNKIKEPFFPF